MCERNIVFWCLVLLIVASSSKCQKNSTNDNKRSDNSTVRYDPLVSSIKYRNNEMSLTQCNSCENSIKNDDKVQYESYVNSTKNDRKYNNSMQYESRGHIIKSREQSNQTFMEPRVNSTDINNFILQDINGNFTKTEGENELMSNKFGNSNTDEYNNITATIVPYEACDDITCIQLCCPFGNKLTWRGKCVAGQGIYYFPAVSTYGNDSEDKKLNELFLLTVRDPCVVQEVGRHLLNSNIYGFFINGSLYSLSEPGKFLSPMFYCLAILDRKIYDVIVCNTNQVKTPVYISACLLISLPFLLLTFVVYSILPELQNIHGYTLRAHIASLFITYAIMYPGQQMFELLAEWRYCVLLGMCINSII